MRFIAILLISSALASFAQEAPLHVRIDQLIEDGNIAPVAGIAEDTTFVRRVYLDLTGGTPTAKQARAFLSDEDPDERAKLVRQLLGQADYVRHMSTTFDVWLMERRPDPHVKTPEWRKYLVESFAQNKSYVQLSKEILGADGTEEKNRAASRFYLGRLGESDALTREVGRIFFGKDLQCAQCHDHPSITDYIQPDYYGMNAFFTRTSLFRPDNKLPAVLAEKGEGEAESVSVFTDVPADSQPRLLGGVTISEPIFAPGDAYVVPPNPKDKKVKWIPKYSRREKLAELATDGTNVAFNRNIVNRLWAHMMGRGLVEPFDFHHSANPPTHPQLLDLLAAEFVKMDYDIQAFLGELALTKTYQRGMAPREELAGDATKLEAELGALKTTSEELANQVLKAYSVWEDAKDNWDGEKLDAEEIITKFKDAKKAADTAGAPAKLAATDLANAKPGFELREKVFLPLDAALKEISSKDVDVTGLIAKLKKDHAAAKTEYYKAKTDFDKKQKAATDAQTKLDAAMKTLAEAKKVADPEQSKVDAAEVAFVKARAAYESVKVKAKAAQRRYDDAKKLIDYNVALSEASATRDLAEQKQQEIAEVAQIGAVAKELQASAKLVGGDFGARLAKDGADLQSAATQLKADRSADAEAAFKDAAAFEKKVDLELVAVEDRWTANFSTGGFTQLTPEQLCTSMMRATGEWERLLAAGEAEFEKKLADQEAKKNQPPPKEEEKKDEKKEPEIVYTEADRGQYIQDYMTRVTLGSMNAFVGLFGGQAGNPQTDFFATADQALFLENNGLVRGWLRPSGENLSARLGKLEEPTKIADELYVSILTRAPTEAETAKVGAYLESRKEEKANAVQEMAWALLSSTEFRFKH
ncbi:MAG: DUF1549 domain-containing protein [Verrucomicrobiota bacterium]